MNKAGEEQQEWTTGSIMDCIWKVVFFRRGGRQLKKEVIIFGGGRKAKSVGGKGKKNWGAMVVKHGKGR